jgi:hypothetical protein
VLLAATILAWSLTAPAAEVIDGISFADDPHILFVPVEEIAPALGWEMKLNQELKEIFLNGQALNAARLRKLTNGTPLVPLDELQRTGATTTWDDDGMQALVASGFFKKAAIRFAAKHVEVDLGNQRLRAYQGARLVLDSDISSGREGRKTPPGDFKARAGQVADASLTALPQRADALERASARERFHSRLPKSAATPGLPWLRPLAAGGRQSRQVVLRLDRHRYTNQHQRALARGCTAR